MFRDRQDAGRRLGELVARELTSDPIPGPVVVLGLARGGLPVAEQVAARLHAPLDVVVVRKLGTPWQPELGMGAIAEGGGRMLNDELIAELGIDAEDVAAITNRERVELERRVRRYRGERRALPVAGATVILVDDGLATGYTARAAVDALRASGAARVILAVPVAPPASVSELDAVADDVIVVEQPEHFYAIGAFYDNFGQTSDEEVIAILERDAGRVRPA
jgi:putative phosphoribosyl transferase